MKKINIISKILVYSLCALFVFMLFALANVSRETLNNNKININNYYADLVYVENVKSKKFHLQTIIIHIIIIYVTMKTWL